MIAAGALEPAAGSSAAPAPAPGWGHVRPRLSPDIAARRIVFRGEPGWVLHHPATGRYLRIHPRLHALLGRLDGSRSVDEALAGLPPPADTAPDDATLRTAVGGLVAQGVLRAPGRTAPAPPQPPFLVGLMRRVVFSRVNLGDLGRALPLAGPLLGWLFTPVGLAVWLALGGIAAAQWLARPSEVQESLRDLFDFGALDAVQAFLVFTAVKLVHECGHAVAASRMAAAEGHRIATFRWGFSFMFMMPAPFVDVTGVWFVGNRWRRALVGVAGVYVECLIAAIAAILWAHAGPGWGRDVLFQTVLVVGISSVLFNLNPLVRLDGYYVLADVLELPNMQQRAMLALRGALRAVAGLAAFPPRAEWPFALWQLASATYRWVIYAGIFWLAFDMHWLLAAGVVGLVGTLFVVLPLVAGVKAAVARPARALAILAGLAAGAAGLLLVPVPDHVVAQGIIDQPGAREVFAPADGWLRAVAPPGRVTAGTELIRVENPETLRTLEQLDRESRSIAIEQRQAVSADPSRIDALAARQAAVGGQSTELQAEVMAWRLVATQDGVWEPGRALALRGEMVRRDDARPLGLLLPEAGVPLVRLVLDQRDGPALIDTLDPARPVLLRRIGGTAGEFTADLLTARPEARGELPGPALAQENGGPIAARRDAAGRLVPAERVFELRLRPRDPVPPLRHAARVQAWLPLPHAPLASQLYRRVIQALQRRLATQ